MEKKKLYVLETDPYYADPYIDEEGWRDAPIRHYYVHGGFRGTEKNGFEVKFCFYFPEKESYGGRFFQYLSPAPEDERESENLTGEDDKISFCLTHGAYYVVSNQGGFQMDAPQRLFRASANTAQFSRLTAQRVYSFEHRPYGYCFGGSGGSFKTMGCMEMTEGVWDGAVPYVLANPMAAPNVFAPRVWAMRILGESGMKKVVDAMEPGGSGDIYAGLDAEQRQALEEVTKMGFPTRGWFSWPTMGDGALMVLAPYIYNVYPQYFTEFWTKPGFAGADPNSSEARSRVRFATTVAELVYAHQVDSEQGKEAEFTSVDNSWQNMIDDRHSTPKVRLSQLPPTDAELFHCRLRVVSGAAAGKEAAVDTIENGVVTVSNPFATGITGNVLEGLQAGDEILIDNSDYLAMQSLQRHQIPDKTYRVYDQYRDADGKPLYPQLPFLLAPIIAQNGAGVVPCGDIHGSLSDVEGSVSEFFIQLTKSIKSSFPLFDEASNHLMQSAVEARIINLNESEKRKIIHAGVSDNLIQRLPTFDSASVDEILDIRKELNDPLVRFRGKVQSYSESIQTVPWDNDFENECSLLYYQEVAPAILEIDELTKEGSFAKNLVGKVTSDGDFRRVANELVIGIAAAGVIPAFTQTVSQDVAALTAGGLWATAKIAEAYKEYREKKREISKKDLYFYYRAGKMLNQ